MKKILLLVTGLMMALFVYTSCTKDDTIVTSSQGTEPESESDGNVMDLLANITAVYGCDAVSVNGDEHLATNKDDAKLKYKFYSSETDLANNIIKISIYFPTVDSTYYLYSNPDAMVNKITYRGEGGSHIDEYKLSNFLDLYQFDSKIVSALDVNATDNALKQALTLTIAYTFAPQLINLPITPSDPIGTLKVNVKGGLYEAVMALASQCGSVNCFRRDGYMHEGNTWLVWGACTC